MGVDEEIASFCQVMRERYGGGADFEESLMSLVAKVREAYHARQRDAQAAELLPLGRAVAAERLGVAPSTVYKMVGRHRRFSTLEREV